MTQQEIDALIEELRDKRKVVNKIIDELILTLQFKLEKMGW